MHKIIFALLLVALVAPGAALADSTQSKCYELQRAVDEARARRHAEDLARQEQTVLQPSPSISDMSCLDSYTIGIDASKYDPASIASTLERQAKQRV